MAPLQLFSQSDPVPASCGFMDNSASSSTILQSSNCGNTSAYWTNESKHLPLISARPIKIHANFIILQKPGDDPGNFQDIPEHKDFLNKWLAECNESLNNLWASSPGPIPPSCGVLFGSSKIEIVPNWIFDIVDEYAWNADNTPPVVSGNTITNFKCPDEPNWHLNTLDAQMYQNYPNAINVYLTVSGNIYNQLVTLGTINNPQAAGMPYWWCAPLPDDVNLLKSSRIHCPNFYMKYVWFKNHPETVVPGGVPFETSIQWLIAEGRTLAHEFGHSCGLYHESCQNNLMTTNWGSSLRAALSTTQVSRMHRRLAVSSLRQFVDCTEVYNQPGATTSDRLVTGTETWDLNMRLYSNVVVKTGGSLTVTCGLLLPYNGTITVERGAKLIVDGGTITKANTCGNNEYWRGIAVNGNAAMAQPLATATPAATESGIVIVKNGGFIEEAVVGITTKKSPFDDDPAYWGGVVDVENGTFRNCRKGVEFMAYDFSLNNSRFKNAQFIRTADRYSYAGATIWGTDGLSFEDCQFLFESNTTGGAAETGIYATDAIFSVTKGNSFEGADIAIRTGATMPLNGEVQIGLPGNSGTDMNVFVKNAVGVQATANSRMQIEKNDFSSFDFDIEAKGPVTSNILNNIFTETTAGNRLDNTDIFSNTTNCNTYNSTLAGINIVGKNMGFNFRQEDFSTVYHDLYIDGHSNKPIPPALPTITAGQIPQQGTTGAARFNFFTHGQEENIKTNSIVEPTNVTAFFLYFHPDPNIDARLKPKCGQGDACNAGITASNFENKQTGGNSTDCDDGPENEFCKTKPCLGALRADLSQKTELLKAGNAATLYTALQNNGSSETTYNQLSAASPYLSEALLTAIANNTAMTTGKKELLLEQNSPLSASLRASLQGKISAAKLAQLNAVAQNGAQSTRDALAANVGLLTTRREYITDELIRQYRAANQWAQVETLLNEDLNPYNRRRLFGAKVKQKQYAAAASVLQAMPIESTDDTRFVQVQTINLARLTTSAYTLSAADSVLLNNIAREAGQSSGYAQTLLGLLKGQVFMAAPLEFEKEEKERSAPLQPQQQLSSGDEHFSIAPNPAHHAVQIQIPQASVAAAEMQVNCFDLVTGSLVHTLQVPSGGSATLPVENWREGMYVFVLYQDGKATARQRVVIQH